LLGLTGASPKAVTGKDKPLDNAFFYEMGSSQGTVLALRHVA
jgi:hypothetical protein